METKIYSHINCEWIIWLKKIYKNFSLKRVDEYVGLRKISTPIERIIGQ